MRKSLLYQFGIITLLMISCNSSPAQKPQNWTQKQLMAPAVLAKTLEANKDIPVIICVGPGAPIPNSIDIGATSDKDNLEKFKKELGKLKKDASIVIYCGCCPYAKCPNVRPAIEVLKSMKYTNFHLLDLPANIKTDWISKGYPVAE